MFAPDGAAAQQQAYGGRAAYGTHELSVRDLLSDDALPDWLRGGGGGEGGGVQGYGQQPAGPVDPRYGAAAWGGQQPPQPGQGYGAPPGWGAQQAPQPGYGAGMPAWGQAEPGRAAPGMPGGPVAGGGAAQRLFDESALPDWLRQPGVPQRPALEAYPTLQQQVPPTGYAPAPVPPSYAPAPQPYAAGSPFSRAEQGGAYQQPSSQTDLSGQSLIDASALPGWLRGEPQAPQSPPANPNAAFRDASGMRGQSLVEESALPAWLRAEAPSASPSSAAAGPRAGASIADWIAGSTANDALPPWLSQAYSAAQIGPAPGTPAGTPPAPGRPAQPARPQVAAPTPGGWGDDAGAANGGYAASQLLDQSALPDWLRAQGAAAASPMGGAWPPAAQPAAGSTARVPQPRFPAGPPESASGPASWGDPSVDSQPVAQRFSASELIDPDALPSWARPGQEPLGAAREPYAAPAAPSPGGAQSWIDEGGYPDDPWSDAASRSARMPAVAGEDHATAVRRALRGSPLAADELPPWLQGTGPDAGSPPMSGRGARPGPPSWPVEDPAYGDGEYAGALDDQDDGEPWDSRRHRGLGRQARRDEEQGRGRRGWLRRGRRDEK